jgi:hypothetical protein
VSKTSRRRKQRCPCCKKPVSRHNRTHVKACRALLKIRQSAPPEDNLSELQRAAVEAYRNMIDDAMLGAALSGKAELDWTKVIDALRPGGTRPNHP